MSRWFLLLALSLSACSSGSAVFQPVASLDEPTAYYAFDLPDEYQVLDIRYESALVALDGDASATGLRERATVQVFARHRETGREALFVYDLARPRQGPRSVIELRPAPPSDAAQR